MRRSFSNWIQSHPVYTEHIWGWVRFLLLIASLLGFTMISCVLFEKADFAAIATEMQQKIPILRLFPTWLVEATALFTEWRFLRHMLMPLAAVSLVFIAGGFYIQNIYNLPTSSLAFHYMFSSMFGFLYPQLEIDGGKMKIEEDEINLLDKVGGPGYVMIQPGNAVIFKDLRRPSNIALPQQYFMKPFEMIGTIANIDEQHGYEKEIGAVTHDGIQVRIRDINYRYRLLPDTENGGKLRERSTQNPYPFSETAMLDMAYNNSVSDRGPDSWQQGVQRAVNGSITDFIGKNDIDYLTAPRKDKQDPRRDLRIQLFAAKIRDQLQKLGTELLWVDAGHFDIVEYDDAKEENVDFQRFTYWAARWIGKDKQVRAVGDAQRMALQEKGRAEAQAELLRNITESLQGFDLKANPVNNLRKLLLIRTAQILEGMREIKSWKRNDKP